MPLSAHRRLHVSARETWGVRTFFLSVLISRNNGTAQSESSPERFLFLLFPLNRSPPGIESLPPDRRFGNSSSLCRIVPVPFFLRVSFCSLFFGAREPFFAKKRCRQCFLAPPPEIPSLRCLFPSTPHPKTKPL